MQEWKTLSSFRYIDVSKHIVRAGTISLHSSTVEVQNACKIAVALSQSPCNDLAAFETVLYSRRVAWSTAIFTSPRLDAFQAVSYPTVSGWTEDDRCKRQRQCGFWQTAPY